MLLIAASSVAPADLTGGQFQITNNTFDGGGGSSSGGAFVLSGTNGQPDASLQSAAGGAFTLNGGFWTSRVNVILGDLIFKDGFEQP